MPPAFFIVWGTKVRTRPRGTRIDYCLGCLRLARHGVFAVETAGHVYYISIGYKEAARFTECEICGTRGEAELDTPAIDERRHGRQSIADLVSETNPDIDAAALANLEKEIAEHVTEEEREDSPFHALFANMTARLAEVSENSFGMFIGLLCVFGFAGAFAYAMVSAAANEYAITGAIVGIASLAGLIWAYRFTIHRRRVRSIKPFVERFASSTKNSRDDLLARLEHEDFAAYPKLRRHLTKPAYEAIDGVHDGV